MVWGLSAALQVSAAPLATLLCFVPGPVGFVHSLSGVALSTGADVPASTVGSSKIGDGAARSSSSHAVAMATYPLAAASTGASLFIVPPLVVDYEPFALSRWK